QVGNRPPVGLLGVFWIGNLSATSLDTVIQPRMEVDTSNVVHNVNSRLILNQTLLVVSNLANRSNLALITISASLSTVLALDVEHDCRRRHFTGLLLNIDTVFSNLDVIFAIKELEHCRVGCFRESHGKLQRVLSFNDINNVKVPVKNLLSRTILRLGNTIGSDIATGFKTKALYNRRRFFRRASRKLRRILRRLANEKAARITNVRCAGHHIPAITAS